MKRKPILKTALFTLLLSLAFVSTVSASPTAQSNKVDVTIQSGEFSLSAPEISEEFGSVVLGADIQILNASFGLPFTVKDLRGTQEGWRLDVQAAPLSNEKHTLPASSLTIEPVANIERVGSGSGTMPTSSQTAATPIDAGSAVGLVSAPKGGGMGVFEITLPADALAVTIDATTARTDGGVYTTTLNWSLVQAP